MLLPVGSVELIAGRQADKGLLVVADRTISRRTWSRRFRKEPVAEIVPNTQASSGARHYALLRMNAGLWRNLTGKLPPARPLNNTCERLFPGSFVAWREQRRALRRQGSAPDVTRSVVSSAFMTAAACIPAAAASTAACARVVRSPAA
jgi:hypothetical protein